MKLRWVIAESLKAAWRVVSRAAIGPIALPTANWVPADVATLRRPKTRIRTPCAH